MQHNSLSLEDFDLVKVIGKGGFSKVFQGKAFGQIIVRKKDTGKIYAMKTLSKHKIKKDNKVENILNERAILENVNHPFIIQMKYAFQNVNYSPKLRSIN
jgi:serine/threonine protein kinase